MIAQFKPTSHLSIGVQGCMLIRAYKTAAKVSPKPQTQKRRYIWGPYPSARLCGGTAERTSRTTPASEILKSASACRAWRLGLEV